MATPYTIYLVNESADTQLFWCFLARPEELADDPGVFANSSVSLAVAPNSPAMNTFTIPVQYVVGAGASNDAVGANIEVVSSVTNNASLLDTWDADYATVPPKEGPAMSLTGAKAAANSIAIVSNAFPKGGNEEAGWFANQSFGIETADGFIGMSWSPDPQKTRTITPKLTFYVAVGSYGSNTLADWDDVSNGSAVIEVPSSFTLNDCTVTYSDSGSFTVTPGKPPAQAMTQKLDWFRSPAHAELVALSHLDAGTVEHESLLAVQWDNPSADAEFEGTYLSGTVTVGTALAAAFSYFLLSGIQFNVTKPARGVTTVRFSYSGPLGATAIRKLFKTGAKLLFGGSK